MTIDSTIETLSAASTGELSDNHLDAVSGGVDLIATAGKCIQGATSDGGGGNGLVAFLAGFAHGLASH
jgi:hypothetical protein